MAQKLNVWLAGAYADWEHVSQLTAVAYAQTIPDATVDHHCLPLRGFCRRMNTGFRHCKGYSSRGPCCWRPPLDCVQAAKRSCAWKQPHMHDPHMFPVSIKAREPNIEFLSHTLIMERLPSAALATNAKIVFSMASEIVAIFNQVGGRRASPDGGSFTLKSTTAQCASSSKAAFVW